MSESSSDRISESSSGRPTFDVFRTLVVVVMIAATIYAVVTFVQAIRGTR